MTKEIKSTYDELLARQDYLVVQSNDLAKAFGRLTSFEHRVLDFCFSYVHKDSKPSDVFVIDFISLLKHFGLGNSGKNYMAVASAFKSLSEKTPLRLPYIEPDGTRSIIFTNLFSYISLNEKGVAKVKYSEIVAPHVFELKKNFYSFKLSELANVKGKYALIMLKQWQSHKYGNNKTTVINTDLKEWQEWFLGENKEWTAGRFKKDVLEVAKAEIEKLFNVAITIANIKRGRKVIGYEVEILDNRKETDADFFKEYLSDI